MGKIIISATNKPEKHHRVAWTYPELKKCRAGEFEFKLAAERSTRLWVCVTFAFKLRAEMRSLLACSSKSKAGRRMHSQGVSDSSAVRNVASLNILYHTDACLGVIVHVHALGVSKIYPILPRWLFWVTMIKLAITREWMLFVVKFTNQTLWYLWVPE